MGPAAGIGLRCYIDALCIFSVAQPEADRHPRGGPLLGPAAGIEGYKGKAPLGGKTDLGLGYLDLRIRDLLQDMLLQLFVQWQRFHAMAEKQQNIVAHSLSPHPTSGSRRVKL